MCIYMYKVICNLPIPATPWIILIRKKHPELFLLITQHAKSKVMLDSYPRKSLVINQAMLND